MKVVLARASAPALLTSLSVIVAQRCVEGGSEHAVELRGDDGIAGLQRCDEGGSLRPLVEGLGTGDAAFDEDMLEAQSVHLGVAGKLPLLNVQALAFIGLGDGGDAAIAVDSAGWRAGGERGLLPLGGGLEVFAEVLGHGVHPWKDWKGAIHIMHFWVERNSVLCPERRPMAEG